MVVPSSSSAHLRATKNRQLLPLYLHRCLCHACVPHHGLQALKECLVGAYIVLLQGCAALCELTHCKHCCGRCPDWRWSGAWMLEQEGRQYSRAPVKRPRGTCKRTHHL